MIETSTNILQSARLSRSDRLEKRGKLIQRLSVIVPPLFAKAHIRDFSPLFRAKLLKVVDPAAMAEGLLLWGAPGVGKTHAMAAIGRYIVTRGGRCRRMTYEMLALQIRDTFKANSTKTELGVIQPLLDCQFLFIEDVGTTVSSGSQESDFSLRTLLVILDHRLEQRRPTFLTSNKSVEGLRQTFDARIASRLQAFMVIQMAGADKRKGRS